MRFLFAGLLFAAALGLSACSSAGGLTVAASGPSSLGKASNVSCTSHAGKVTVAGTFTGGPSSGVVGFSTSIHDSNGRQIGSENNVSIEVENQQSAPLGLLVPVHGDPSSCNLTWRF
jgi:hypothetical protein